MQDCITQCYKRGVIDMTKKDCVAIAAIINSVGTEQSGEMYKSILVSRLAVCFTARNDRFKSDKFRAACYKVEKEQKDE
jgi:hypothetical protein